MYSCCRADLNSCALLCAESRAITEQGFQFLLQDSYSQLWRLLRAYITGGEHRSGARHPLLR
jgi:hypothetical protein